MKPLNTSMMTHLRQTQKREMLLFILIRHGKTYDQDQCNKYIFDHETYHNNHYIDFACDWLSALNRAFSYVSLSKFLNLTVIFSHLLSLVTIHNDMETQARQRPSWWCFEPRSYWQMGTTQHRDGHPSKRPYELSEVSHVQDITSWAWNRGLYSLKELRWSRILPRQYIQWFKPLLHRTTGPQRKKHLRKLFHWYTSNAQWKNLAIKHLF